MQVAQSWLSRLSFLTFVLPSEIFHIFYDILEDTSVWWKWAMRYILRLWPSDTKRIRRITSMRQPIFRHTRMLNYPLKTDLQYWLASYENEPFDLWKMNLLTFQDPALALFFPLLDVFSFRSSVLTGCHLSGDSEGDTPLAHARYFNAPDLYKLYDGSGATLAGPFYAAARNLGIKA